MEHTIAETVESFLGVYAASRSANTERTYRIAMEAFRQMLAEQDIPYSSSVNILSEKMFKLYYKNNTKFQAKYISSSRTICNRYYWKNRYSG